MQNIHFSEIVKEQRNVTVQCQPSSQPSGPAGKSTFSTIPEKHISSNIISTRK